jgi:hypothetical protein
MMKRMIFLIKKIDKHVWILIITALLVVGRLLQPGYVLTLDMIFAPGMRAAVSASGYGNFLPVGYLLQFFNIIIPAWLIQKAILLALFLDLGWLAFKFLPLPADKTARLFAALIYMLNPFVYGRFLAGDWRLLFAYSLLPIFVNFLFVFTSQPNFRASLKLFAIIFLISLFSLHFLAMSSMVMAVWFCFGLITSLFRKDYQWIGKFLNNFLLGAIFFVAASSYWLIPAWDLGFSLEKNFGPEHWQAFAAQGHGRIGAALNVLSLNGFWGEAQPWARQFFWPQDYPVFWVALSFIVLLILIGLIFGWKDKKSRTYLVFFSILGISAFIFSTGAGATFFRGFNLWFYQHVPFWRGFRDSQKFGGWLALSYAVLSGIGLSVIIDFFRPKNKEWTKDLCLVIFLIPIMFGFLLWGGLRGQLRPVWYPQAWDQAKKIIQASQKGDKALFLPWHGYLSLRFNNDLLTANPARIFFGNQAIVSQSVELGGVYDQQLDIGYATLDKAVTGESGWPDDEIIEYLGRQKIKYIVYSQDIKEVDNLRYSFLNSRRLELIINDPELLMYKIKN